MLTIAHSELVQIVRNQAILFNSFIMPVAASVFFIYFRDELSGGPGYIAAAIVFTIGAFSLYTTIVTTLAGRRQNLFLKRLRSTTAGDGAILFGLALPVSAFALFQVAAILGVFAAVGNGPASISLLAIAIIATFVMLFALGLATAGVTNTPEQAQVTTLPISVGIVAVASWVGISGTESLTWLKRLLPGGSATELVVGAWDGGVSLTDSLLLLAPTLGWIAVAIALASTMFRWEPRR